MQRLRRVFVTAALLVGAVVLSAPAATAATTACGPNKVVKKKSEVPATAQRVVIPVKGMTCGVSADKLMTALAAISGVYEARVSIDDEHASVAYDAKQVGVDALVKAIVDAGYTPGKPGADRDRKA